MRLGHMGYRFGTGLSKHRFGIGFLAIGLASSFWDTGLGFGLCTVFWGYRFRSGFRGSTLGLRFSSIGFGIKFLEYRFEM